MIYGIRRFMPSNYQTMHHRRIVGSLPIRLRLRMLREGLTIAPP
jgi:hypothetical protein